MIIDLWGTRLHKDAEELSAWNIEKPDQVLKSILVKSLRNPGFNKISDIKK